MKNLSLNLDNTFLKKRLQTRVEEALKSAFPEAECKINIEYPSQAAHGDYACNLAMQLTKQLGLPPREIAEKVVAAIDKTDLIDHIDIAGPGFINFFISKEQLLLQLDESLKTPELGSKKIIVEYSQPNIAKPLGVHHLLSTIIGQSLYNIFKYLNFDTTSINYIGDWGTQFGKLIYAYKQWGDKETVEKDPITELLKLYVKFHEEAEKNPELEDEGRREFKIFEEGDSENRELWKWFVAESLKEIQKTYDKLGGIHFDYTQGESFYEKATAPMLAEGKKLGIFEEGKEGSFVVHYDDENMAPFVVQKKDGTTLYSTRDFCALKHRIEDYKADHILYVVDIAQTLHFKQLYEGASRFPWYDDQATHVWFGRMHLKDGKASTRKGNVILLNEVLDEAVSRAMKIVEEKSPNIADKENVARVLGIGAIKYNVISQNRTTDITFDWDRMLSFEGNSAPYLQYTYARGRSILRRGKIEGDSIADPEDAAEKIRQLIAFIPKFRERLTDAAKEYKPNILATYIFELAQKFNSFYNSVPVLKASSDSDREERLKIIETTTQVIKNGLSLLGVEVVEEM